MHTCARLAPWAESVEQRQSIVMFVTDQPAFTEIAATPVRRRRLTPDQALDSSPGRVRDIAALRGLGFTYREISQYYNVTPQAVSLLLSRHHRKMEAIGGRPLLVALSSRATTALRRLGVETREDAVAAKVLSKLAHARNCGRKTLDEIEHWMSKTTSDAPQQQFCALKLRSIA